jgi:hypothetical protein
MSTVRDFLTAKKAEIVGKLEPLMIERMQLWTKVMEIESTITALRQEIQKVDLALRAVDDSAASRPPTIMEAVLEVLKRKPDGMTAQEILAEINVKYFDGKIVRPSLSPQLSRLKDRDKKIELRGNRWFRLPDQPGLFPPTAPIKRRSP